MIATGDYLGKHRADAGSGRCWSRRTVRRSMAALGIRRQAERHGKPSRHWSRKACRRNTHRVRSRTVSSRAVAYSPFMRLMESDMNTFGNKIFGAIIGSTIFFGVGIALAHAGSLVV